MPIPELLATLDSEFGVVITADETEKMTVPIEGRPLEVPQLAGAILVRVKDDKLYDLLVNRLQMALGQTMPMKTMDTPALRMITVQVPQTGLPLTPTLARFGHWLVISTSESLVHQLARAEPNPPPLMRDTPAFQRFAKLEKLEANAFTYLSERGANILRTIQLSSMKAQPGLPPQLEENLSKFYDFFSQKFCFSVGRVEKDGYATTMYSAHGSEQIVAVMVGVPLGIAAAVAMPALVESKHRDEATRSLAELRTLDAVIKQYTTEANLAPGTIIPPSELARYVSETSSLGKRLQEGPVLNDPFGHPYSPFIAGQPPRVPARLPTSSPACARRDSGASTIRSRNPEKAEVGSEIGCWQRRANAWARHVQPWEQCADARACDAGPRERRANMWACHAGRWEQCVDAWARHAGPREQRANASARHSYAR